MRNVNADSFWWLLHRVSADASVSNDEEDDQDNDSNNSFIDDRINPTAAGTQSETSRVDMMAIYRFLANSLSFKCYNNLNHAWSIVGLSIQIFTLFSSQLLMVVNLHL